MKADKHFANELEMIMDSKIRNFVRLALENVPDKFWTMPASSGGKYHPTSSQGYGGLITHTREVVYIAKTIIESKMFNLEKLDIDCIYASCILHDGWKYPNESFFTHKHHATIASNRLVELAEKEGLIAETWLNPLVSCVLAHNGYFTKEYVGEHSDIQKIVHLADFIASRKFLVFDTRLV